MKKLIVVLLVFALMGTALFAQTAPGVTVGGWGRSVFSPLKVTLPDGGDATVGSEVVTNLIEGRIAGSAEKIGFETYVRYDGSGTATWGDNAYVWVKPISILKIGGGKFNGAFDAGLRGKIGNGSSNGMLAAAGINAIAKGEDDIFKRFASNAGGVILLQPIEGLTIGAVFNARSAKNELDLDYANLQIGAGYTIGNIGVIRAQLLRGPNDGSDAGTKYGTPTKIQAAFALTAVENLTLDIGATIPLKYESEDTYEWQDAISINVGAKYTAGDFSILGRADAYLMKYYEDPSNTKFEEGIDIYGLVEPAFKLGTITVAADVALEFTTEDKNDGKAVDNKGGLKLGAGVWAGIPLGNGDLKLGVMAMLPTEYDGSKTPLVVAIPLSMQYSF
ncbi:MAG: hypothetical protein LBE17_10105 [Treponema sp.]|jgi:hypothetical protein|nr:hypothetical protein [Treponema sp.]